jgi:hypothetical protein
LKNPELSPSAGPRNKYKKKKFALPGDYNTVEKLEVMDSSIVILD